MPIELVMPSNYLILRHPLLFLPSIFPSIRVFSNELALHIRWPKYWSFSFNISPSNEHPGLISFRMDWLDPLAVQGTLKSLLCEAARVNTMTGGLDLSFGFPRNVKIPHPHQVTWSQPINMRPVRNKGRAEKPAKVCTNKIALQTCNQSA